MAGGGQLGLAKPEWTLGDHLGAIGVRLNIGRMSYRVTPGLYTLGTPDADTPVFVTANYKLSFASLSVQNLKYTCIFPKFLLSLSIR